MKVLRQDWNTPEGHQTSLSKNQAQIDATLKKLKEKEPEVELDGTAEEVTIPDNSVFADMVRNGIVFLHPDEMDVLYDANDNEKQSAPR